MKKRVNSIAFTLNYHYISAWFLVGFFVFHVPPLKNVAEALDKLLDIIVVISLFPLNFWSGMGGVLNLVTNAIIGFFAYKIGSNFGRQIKMNLGFNITFFFRIIGYLFGAYIVYSFFSNL